jgi:hypothetical protein
MVVMVDVVVVSTNAIGTTTITLLLMLLDPTACYVTFLELSATNSFASYCTQG